MVPSDCYWLLQLDQKLNVGSTGLVLSAEAITAVESSLEMK